MISDYYLNSKTIVRYDVVVKSNRRTEYVCLGRRYPSFQDMQNSVPGNLVLKLRGTYSE